MVSIKIKYDTISPFLRTMTGTLLVEEVNVSDPNTPPIELIKCKITKESGTTGFTSLPNSKGIDSELFEFIRPIVSSMLESYWRGLTLSKIDFNWIILEGSDSYLNLSKLSKKVEEYINKTRKEEL